MRAAFLFLILFPGLGFAQVAYITDIENRNLMEAGFQYVNVTVTNYREADFFNVTMLVNGSENDSAVIYLTSGGANTTSIIFRSGLVGACYNVTLVLYNQTSSLEYDRSEREVCVTSAAPKRPSQIIVPEYPSPLLLISILACALFLARPLSLEKKS